MICVFFTLKPPAVAIFIKAVPDLLTRRIDKRVNGRIEKMAVVIIIFPVIGFPYKTISFKESDG